MEVGYPRNGNRWCQSGVSSTCSSYSLSFKENATQPPHLKTQICYKVFHTQSLTLAFPSALTKSTAVPNRKSLQLTSLVFPHRALKIQSTRFPPSTVPEDIQLGI